MTTPDTPRTIDPAEAFDALVQWFHDEIIVQRGAPGFLIGLSGTDSLVTFLAASKAFEMVGKPERVLGIHFAPSEDFLDYNPEAEVHLWFSNEVIPWLRQQTPKAEIAIDTTIDWRHDGLRWGLLLDRSAVADRWTAGQLSSHPTRRMLLPEEQRWVVGTRNKTEDVLLSYSNASMAVSLQPLIHLWKSEILQISEYLGVPKIAIDKSCETDCICGRMRLPAQHIQEVDLLLMIRCGELVAKYVEGKIAPELRLLLVKFIESQISKGKFKKNIPYSPDPLVLAFENGSLNIKEFDHRKHVYVAWYYLKNMPFGAAVGRYADRLFKLLNSNGYTTKFNLEVTEKYFYKIDAAMKLYPTDNFDELMGKAANLLKKQ